MNIHPQNPAVKSKMGQGGGVSDFDFPFRFGGCLLI
jgi:hypothetical protein